MAISERSALAPFSPFIKGVTECDRPANTYSLPCEASPTRLSIQGSIAILSDRSIL